MYANHLYSPKKLMFNQINLSVYKQSLTSFKETVLSSSRALIQGIRKCLSTTFYLLGCHIKKQIQTYLSLKLVNITLDGLNLFA